MVELVAARKYAPFAGRTSPGHSYTRLLQRIHRSYLAKLLLRFTCHIQLQTEFGQIDLTPTYPHAPADLVKDLDFEAFPHFALVDGLCITMPFRVNGQYFVVRRQPFGVKIPSWAGNILLRRAIKDSSRGRLQIFYLDGQGFESERLRRLRLLYTPNEYSRMGSLVIDNPKYREWLSNQIGHCGRILSIGCGESLLEEQLLKQHNNDVVGIELNPALVKKARKNGLCVVEGNAQYLSELLRQNGIQRKFDTVLAGEAIGYFWWETFVAEVKMVLSPSGSFILVTALQGKPVESLFTPHYQYFKWNTLRGKLAEAGFTVIKNVFLRANRQSFSSNWPPESGITQNADEANQVFVKATKT